MSPTNIGKKRVSFQRRKAAVPAATAPVPTPAAPARKVDPAKSSVPDLDETPPSVGKSFIPVQSIQDAWRKSPGAWFEAYGAIYDKDRNLLKNPILNSMQQRLDDIVVWCHENDVPCRIVTLKGRQQGSSTWSVGALYHETRKKRTNALLIGDSYERSVANLENMFNLFAAEDEFSWGNTYDRPSGKFSNGSKFSTETAKANRAGASGTYQAVLCTEVAHWQESAGISAKKVFAALMSCVPKRQGTLVIVESTPNGVGGVYYDTYQKAISFEDLKAGKKPADWNGFVKVFYPWHEHPEYQIPVTEGEEREIMDSLGDRETELVEEFPHITPAQLQWRRRKILDPDFNGDEEFFEQEYPSDEERGFLMSGRRSFPLLPLQQMLKRAEREGQAGLHPKMLKWADANERIASPVPALDEEAWIKIFEEPKPGLRYSLAGDPMTGQASGGDPDNHSFGVWREGYFDTYGEWHAPKLAARITDYLAERRLDHKKAACRWDIHLAESRIAMAAAYYGWCQIVVEINMDRGLVELLKLRPRANIYVRVVYNRTQQTDTKEYGWLTSPKTRGPILENLKRLIRVWDQPGTGIDILDVPTIKEMMTMVVDDKGREEAMKGHHDDQVLQTAIGIQTLAGGTIMPNPGVNRTVRQQPTDSTYRA